jgi:hypothetical protein
MEDKTGVKGLSVKSVMKVIYDENHNLTLNDMIGKVKEKYSGPCQNVEREVKAIVGLWKKAGGKPEFFNTKRTTGNLYKKIEDILA